MPHMWLKDYSDFQPSNGYRPGRLALHVTFRPSYWRIPQICRDFCQILALIGGGVLLLAAIFAVCWVAGVCQ